MIRDQDSAIGKIYLYVKDLNEAKYQLLIKKRKDVGLKDWNNPKAFIEYWNTMGDVYNNIHNFNRKRNRKKLIVFGDMIADMNTNKNLEQWSKNYLLDARNEFISCIYHTVLFSCSKKCQIKFYALSYNEDP